MISINKYTISIFALLLFVSFGCLNISSTNNNEPIIVNDYETNFNAVTNNQNKQEYPDFIEERNQFLRNLTSSEAEYQYYLEHESGFIYEDTYRKASSTNEFLSRNETVYKDINGEDVTTNLYYVPYYSVINHPNIGIGLMLYKAIKYKLAYPDEYNEITITSFHFSIIAGVNLVETSDYYGTMRSMPDGVIDSDGFVRFSYLVLFAAKIGIHVNVVSQLPGYSNYGEEIDPKEFFLNHLEDDCFGDLSEHKTKEFLHFQSCDWVSYGAKPGSDMYHVKSCATLHYLGNDNKVHDNTIFLSSSNLDGIDKNGVPGLEAAQTGILVSNHRYLYLSLVNFIKYTMRYCDKYDAAIFRYEYKKIVNQQREIIANEGYDNIEDSMMIYLGTESDDIFELYFTPFDEGFTKWSNDNPFARYIDVVTECKGAIGCYWINPKFDHDSSYTQVFVNRICNMYKTSRNEIEVENSVLFVEIPKKANPFFDELEEGRHMGHKVVKQGSNHQKDIILTYKLNGSRNNIILFNSMNFHDGAFFYQTNHILVLKENEQTTLDLSDTLIQSYTSH